MPEIGLAADPLRAEELLRALEASRWRRSEAARVLGIRRTTLWRRMREADLA